MPQRPLFLSSHKLRWLALGLLLVGATVAKQTPSLSPAVAPRIELQARPALAVIQQEPGAAKKVTSRARAIMPAALDPATTPKTRKVANNFFATMAAYEYEMATNTSDLMRVAFWSRMALQEEGESLQQARAERITKAAMADLELGDPISHAWIQVAFCPLSECDQKAALDALWRLDPQNVTVSIWRLELEDPEAQVDAFYGFTKATYAQSAIDRVVPHLLLPGRVIDFAKAQPNGQDILARMSYGHLELALAMVPIVTMPLPPYQKIMLLCKGDNEKECEQGGMAMSTSSNLAIEVLLGLTLWKRGCETQQECDRIQRMTDGFRRQYQSRVMAKNYMFNLVRQLREEGTYREFPNEARPTRTLDIPNALNKRIRGR